MVIFVCYQYILPAALLSSSRQRACLGIMLNYREWYLQSSLCQEQCYRTIIIKNQCCHVLTHLFLCHSTRIDSEIHNCADITSFVNPRCRLKEPFNLHQRQVYNEVKNKIKLFSGTTSPVPFQPSSSFALTLLDFRFQCGNYCRA